jgi:hypothetical protein
MLQAQINFADLVRQREEDGAYSAQVHTRRHLSSYDNNWGLSHIPGAQAMIDELDTEYSGTLKIITDIPVSVYTYLSVYVYNYLYVVRSMCVILQVIMYMCSFQ